MSPMGHRYENYAHLEGRLYSDPVRMWTTRGNDGVCFQIEVTEEHRKQTGTYTLKEVFDIEMEFLNSRLLLTLKQGDHVAVDAQLRIRPTANSIKQYYFVAHRAYSHSFRSAAVGNTAILHQPALQNP